jgi:hypothetical protein
MMERKHLPRGHLLFSPAARRNNKMRREQDRKESNAAAGGDSVLPPWGGQNMWILSYARVCSPGGYLLTLLTDGEIFLSVDYLKGIWRLFSTNF